MGRGETFEAPEVRTVSVNIAPIKTTNIEVDKVYLEGSVVTDGPVSLTKTLEKNNQYAFVGNLKEGDLQIPVEVEGDKYFVSVNNEEQLDGSPDSVYLNENAFHWKIKKARLYRIVLDLEAANIRIYSTDYKLEPKIVQWNDGSGNLVNTEISDLYMHGAINNWGAPIKMNCNVSLADPQILVYTNGRVGKAKFIVYGGNDNNKNLSYAFSCQPKSTTEAQELPLTLGKLSGLFGGYTKAQRDSYYTIPTGTTMLILDLINNTILAEKR